MIEQLRIRNFKSIEDVSIDLGRVNVFIGENGAGKSNILEAFALAGGAQAGKLDNEFLSSRGIRVTSPALMRSGFDRESCDGPILIDAKTEDGTTFLYELTNDNKPYSQWISSISVSSSANETYMKEFAEFFVKYLENKLKEERAAELQALRNQLDEALSSLRDSPEEEEQEKKHLSLSFRSEVPFEFPVRSNTLSDFVIYSPENTALRTFEREGQIEPLGVNGEGLLKLLTVLASEADQGPIVKIKTALKMLGWFKDFSITEDDVRTRMDIVDRYLSPEVTGFDQRSANEGFLFVTFYFALFSTVLTPKFFAIDNIDASLNPKLCAAMMRTLGGLSASAEKQVILTTHNPAVLDGLDLRDDRQRLFVVSRNSLGKTRVRRYQKPLPENLPSRMSELFLRGMIGGLPKSF